MTENKEVKKYPLTSLYFYLTEGCNLACRHCWIEPKYQGEGKEYPALDIALFRSILKQAKPLGLSRVKLTGGEPLMHPHIREMLDIIQIGDLSLTVETNGVLCTYDLAKQMKECKNTFVSVSIDGSDAETHEWVRGVKGSFEAAKEGIRNLVKAGFKPQVIMSIMRYNKTQIETVVRLAEDLGAGSVKFNLVQPTARGETMHKTGQTLTIEELVEIGRWVEGDLQASSKIKLIYSHPHAFKPLHKLFGKNGDGCGTCGIFSILGVLANGSFALCGIGETVPEFVFGHGAKDKLEEVWNNTPMLKEIREGLPARLEGVCGKCLMKNRCLGSCIAQNYYRTKSLWAPFWYCEEALQAGLFAKSRLSLTQ